MPLREGRYCNLVFCVWFGYMSSLTLTPTAARESFKAHLKMPGELANSVSSDPAADIALDP